MSYPKVLILGQPFNRNTGGGITLSNLFAGWPKDKLAVACSGYLLGHNTDTRICETYYQLGHEEDKWVFPLNLVKRKYPSGLVTFENKVAQNVVTKKSKLRVSVIRKYLDPFLEYTTLSNIVSRSSISPGFRRWLDTYQPEILYIQTSSLDGIQFCNAVSDYLQIPMVFHMMDDWPTLISTRGLFKKYWTRKMDKAFRSLLDRASLLLSISDYMSEAYQQRYGKKFIPFHNPTDISFWQSHQKNDWTLKPAPRILYAGRTSLGIDSSLMTIARAVERVNEALGTQLGLSIQTGKKPGWIDRFDCVEHKPFVPYEELPRVFAAADFLLLPYDFSAKSVKFIKYSMPTKASEFMVSGTPILVFAPADTAIVKYAEAFEWAKIVTENRVEELAEALKDLMLRPDERKALAGKATALALERHDAQRVCEAFHDALCELVPAGQVQTI